MPAGAEPRMQIRIASASTLRKSGSITNKSARNSQNAPHIDPTKRHIQIR
jgi:hypothetical protein